MDRRTQKPRLGQLLVRAGVLDAGSLERALAEQQRSGRPLGRTLVELGLVSEQVLVATLGHQLGLPIARIASWPVNGELRELVPAELAEKHRCLPLALKDEGGRQSLYLAMADPSDLDCLEAVRAATGREIRIVLVAPSEMDAALAACYGAAAPEPCALAADSLPAQAPSVPTTCDAESLHHWSTSRDEVLALLAEDASSPDGPAMAAASRMQATAPAEPGEAPIHEIRTALDRRRLEELDAMVKLLMQLLVEGGVVSRDDLVRRLSELIHDRR